jgi:hypothetical protein
MNVCLSDKMLLERHFRVNRLQTLDLAKYWDGIATEIIMGTRHGPALCEGRRYRACASR